MIAGRKCAICEHAKRKEIDKSLSVDGTSLRAISRQFSVSKDSLSRHVKAGHVADKIAKAVKAHDVVEADDLLKEIQEIHGHQKTIFKEARERKAKNDKNEDVPNPDNRLALEALRDQSKIVELKGKVLGSFSKDKDIKPGETVPAIVMSEDTMRQIGDILAAAKAAKSKEKKV